MSTFIGIDPGVKRTGFAVVDQDCNVLQVEAFKAKCVEGMCGLLGIQFDLWSCTCAVVEGQDVSYTSGAGKNPQSLIPVAQVAGAATAALGIQNDDIRIVKPKDWKKQVPKQIHQARICTRLGWKYEKRSSDYVRPLDAPFKLNIGDWKEALDAIGLALYARDTWAKEQRRK